MVVSQPIHLSARPRKEGYLTYELRRGTKDGRSVSRPVVFLVVLGAAGPIAAAGGF
jgi:hypothetical protein